MTEQGITRERLANIESDASLVGTYSNVLTEDHIDMAATLRRVMDFRDSMADLAKFGDPVSKKMVTMLDKALEGTA